MEAKDPSPQTTLVVLLGASEWPKFPDFQSSRAFANSASELKNYLLDASHFGLPGENLLDLFDTDQSADDIDEQIAKFLEQRIADMKASGAVPTDLLVYFVGHGGWAAAGSDYFLAIRRTRRDHPGVSAIRMESLAYTIKEKARRLRRIIILDCCFASAALRDFMGAPAQTAILQTVAAFETSRKVQGVPGRGTTLLCSSGSTIPSVISRSGDYTMFTHALLQALSTGSPQYEEHLSLRDVIGLTIDALRDESDEEVPRPQLHSPDQSEGDIANIPFFPNPALKASLKADAFAPRKTKKDWLKEGNDHYKEGKSREALVAYDHALALDPDYAQAFARKGRALQALKHYDEALAAYDHALALDPNYASAYNSKGHTLHDLGRYEEALDYYSQAIRLNPGYYGAYTNRGSTLYVLKRYEEAVEACDRAIAIEPRFAYSYDIKGKILQALQRYREALEAYEQAIRLDPDIVSSREGRSNTLKLLGRSKEA